MLIISIILALSLTVVNSAFGSRDPVNFFRYGFPQEKSRNGSKTSQNLKIICHGFKGSSNSPWCQEMIAEFLKKNFSVIAIDFKEFADGGYLDAITTASHISEELTKEVLNVKTKYGFDLSKIHIIGHSLGAHIAGYTGKSIFNSTGEKIGRITGLDPAGPGFHGVLSNSRLSKEDATFVDVIHTDSDLLGIRVSIGQADFYPNGGAYQKNCDIIDLGCSHRTAPYYFIESIKYNNFIARKCDSYLLYLSGFCNWKEEATMGLECDSTANGDYFLITNSKSPYGKGL